MVKANWYIPVFVAAVWLHLSAAVPATEAGAVPITADTGPGGRLEPVAPAEAPGSIARFAVRPDNRFVVERISGCGGELEGFTYTTTPREGEYRIEATFAPADETAPLGSGRPVTHRCSMPILRGC